MKLLYENITYKIRGACYEVYKELGPAYKESAYKKLWLMSLLLRG